MPITTVSGQCPVSSNRQTVYSIWVAAGCPSVHSNEVARKFYGAKFTAGSAITRKQMVLRCRGLIERQHMAELEAKVIRLTKELQERASSNQAPKKGA